jgi:putative acetyltransferase
VVHEDVIAVDDPRLADVQVLLATHLAHMRSQSPPENVFALDARGLLDPAVTFFSYRRRGELLAIGALKHLSDDHAEVKSMHTAEAARGAGIGRAMLLHLIDTAADRGYRLLSLETGTMPGFAAARALYSSAGFAETDAFAGYPKTPHSVFMSLALRERRRREQRRRGHRRRRGLAHLGALLEPAEERGQQQ